MSHLSLLVTLQIPSPICADFSVLLRETPLKAHRKGTEGMTSVILPPKYPQLWMDLPEAYVACVAAALIQQGVQIANLWPDPWDPRDATIKLAGPKPLALVWDEVSGWKYGPFLAGHRGVRTELDPKEVKYLGDAVLPAPHVVARLFTAGEASFSPPLSYRSYLDFADGLDEELQAYGNKSHPYGRDFQLSAQFEWLVEPLLARNSTTAPGI